MQPDAGAGAGMGRCGVGAFVIGTPGPASRLLSGFALGELGGGASDEGDALGVVERLGGGLDDAAGGAFDEAGFATTSE